MEELIKLIEEKIGEEPMFVIGKLTEVLRNQHNNLMQYEQHHLFNVRFHERFFKLFPEQYQIIMNELQLEDLDEEDKNN